MMKLFLPYANNKGADHVQSDQHLCCSLSHFLDSIIPILAKFEL